MRVDSKGMVSSDRNVVDWNLVTSQVEAMAEGEPFWLPVLANVSALLGEQLANINWVGFYVSARLLDASTHTNELVLGPFQGKVACVHIPWGRGVCGTAAKLDHVQRVDDVHAFEGHIACDAASRSEIVVPLHARGTVVGVLDIDSPQLARFDQSDEEGLAACVAAIERSGCL